MVRKVLFFVCFVAVAFATRVNAQESQEQLASYYFQNREYDKAIELYEPLYARTQNQFYYEMLLSCYTETERYKDAERLVERRMKQHQRDLTLLVDLGTLMQKEGNRKKAERQYESAIGKLGRDTKQTGDLAAAFEKIGRYDHAAGTYLKSRELMGNELLYVMELATLYEKAGEHQKMMGEYFNLLDKSPKSIGSIQIALQRSLNETSGSALADGLRTELVSRLREQPDNSSYLEMMIWFSLQQKDFEFALTQAKAVDARFADNGAVQVYRVAQIARNNDALEVAAEAYRYIIGKGKEHALYFDSRVGLLDVMFRQMELSGGNAAEWDKLAREYESALAELGRNQRTIGLMRNYARLLAYYGPSTSSMENLQKASDLLYDIIEMPRVPQNTLGEVKLELGDLMLFAGEVWEASLLYGQVEKSNKNDVLGATAKFKNAKLSYYNNDFEWAKSQLDVLRASTSKLIANDAMQLSLLISDNMEEDSTYEMLSRYAAADLLIYRGFLDSAWTLLEEIGQRTLSHPLFDEIAMQKARIRMSQHRYAEADTLLQYIVDHYSEDILADDALFMLAELNEERLKNPARARDCYERILLDYSSSLYCERARQRYNALKRASE